MNLILKSLILLFCFGDIFPTKVSYEGYKVYEVLLKNKDELNLFEKLKNNNQVDVWSKHRLINVPVHAMVTPAFQPHFENKLRIADIEFDIIIQDVERNVEKNIRKSLSTTLNDGDASFDKYMRHSEINAYLEKLAATYPNLVTKEVIGQSYEGRNLTLVKISSGGSGKPIIFAEGAMHAREWMGPALAIYLINQLVENPDNQQYLDKVDWVILPVTNADGYEYTFTDERFWRKTRSPGTKCVGVDGNRNFGFHWAESGADADECSDIYEGPREFSELETSALRDAFFQYQQNTKLYVSLHSYGGYFCYPYSYEILRPPNSQELQALAEEVADAIRLVAGTNYTLGSSAEILYPAAGCSDDYAMGAVGIPLVYFIELPGGGSDGFNPPEEEILPIVTETWEGFKVLHNHVANKYGHNV